MPASSIHFEGYVETRNVGHGAAGSVDWYRFAEPVYAPPGATLSATEWAVKRWVAGREEEAKACAELSKRSGNRLEGLRSYVTWQEGQICYSAYHWVSGTPLRKIFLSIMSSRERLNLVASLLHEAARWEIFGGHGDITAQNVIIYRDEFQHRNGEAYFIDPHAGCGDRDVRKLARLVHEITTWPEADLCTFSSAKR